MGDINTYLNANWELSSKKEKKNPETGEKRDHCKSQSSLWAMVETQGLNGSRNIPAIIRGQSAKGVGQ